MVEFEGYMLLQSTQKSALGNSPALAYEAFTPEDAQVEFRLSRDIGGVVMVFVNGLGLRYGTHYAVCRNRITTKLDYDLGPSDTVDICYEVVS